MIEIYTDGSHRDGLGVFAVEAYQDNQLILSHSQICEETANACEILAIAFALFYFKEQPIHIHSDNQYAVKGFHKEIKLKKNIDLWTKALALFDPDIAVISYIPKAERNDRHRSVDKLASQSLDHHRQRK